MENAPSLCDRLTPGNLFAGPCPSRQVLKHVCSQWGVLVLIALQDEGIMRFGELRKKLDGVSEKMLAQTLQSLAADGFILRKSYQVVPPHTEYSLTPIGKEVSEHVGRLTCWIESNLHRVLEAREKNTDTMSG